MTRRSNRSLGKAALLVLAVLPTLTACLSKDGRMDGGGGRGGEAAVLASIGGIADQDLARPDLGYFLACNNGIRVKGETKKVADKEYVRFPGDGIEDGKTSCAMEIRADVKDENYIWFARENGQPVKGFLYGSNEKLVDKRGLALTLYKLYSIKETPEVFAATVSVELELVAPVTMPEDAKTVASLQCGDVKVPGTFAKGAEKQATLKFPNLDVKTFKGKKCEKLVLLVDAVEAFVGETAAVEPIEFKDPKKADELKFPTDAAKKYLMKVVGAAIENDNTIDIGTENGGPCLHYENSKCLDMVEFDKLPGSSNYVVALVEGKTNAGEGERVAYYVAFGKDGVQALTGKLTRDALNKALKADADAAAKDSVHFYTEALGDMLFKLPFDASVVSGEALAAHKVARDELADTKKVMFLNIQKVWVHAFQAVDAPTLNAIAEAGKPAHWYANVLAKKDGQADLPFFVTGFDKYFRSAKPAATEGTKGVFFKDSLFLEDMKSAAPAASWRVYAVKGGAMAAATCEIEKDYVMTLQPELIPVLGDGPLDAKLDACEITKDKFKPELLDGSWKLEASFGVMGWYIAGKCPNCGGN